VALPLLDGPFNIQRADHPVLRRADGEVHETGAAPGPGKGLPGGGPFLAESAPGGRLVGVAGEGTIGDDFYLRQQRGQGAGRGGLARPPLAANQHPADLGVDGIQDQRPAHQVLVDDGGKGKNGWHGSDRMEIGIFSTQTLCLSNCVEVLISTDKDQR